MDKGRNCGNKYPKSKFRYYISKFTITQCPKTYITRDITALIEYYDLCRNGYLEPEKRPEKIPNRWIEFISVIEHERAKIEKSKQMQAKLKQGLNRANGY